MIVNIPYSEIVQQFRTACDLHLGVGSFDTGTIDFLDATAVNKTYPLVYLRPTNGIGYSERTRILNFDLFALDIPKLSDESPVEVQSRTEMILYDLLAYFNFGDIQQTYTVDMLGLSPVNEAFEDRAFGWVANIQVSTPFKLDYCDYPDGSIPAPTPVVPTPTPTPVSPTPTPAPVPTPSPTPTPTPIPVPSNVGFFDIPSDATTWFDGPDVLRSCDVYGPNVPTVRVYATDDGSVLPFPDGMRDNPLYTDPELTQLFLPSPPPLYPNITWTIMNPNSDGLRRQIGIGFNGSYYALNNIENCS